MNSERIETCMFFVDDSNIWIEAQKIAASGRDGRIPKLSGSDRDPRLRINLGQLLYTICKRRQIGHSFLYGSRPPPSDSVWDVANSLKFEVKVYDRSETGTGSKEKEVDNSMATDMSHEAAELSVGARHDEQVARQKEATTFIVITGDRDMRPPVLRVLKSGLRVELWAWKSALSQEFAKLSAENGLLSVFYLDQIFDEISFTSYRSTRKGHLPDPAATLVLCDFDENSALFGSDLELSICGQVIHLGELFYVTWSRTGQELFVEFPNANTTKALDSIIARMRKRFEGMLKVLSWLDYTDRCHVSSPAVVETSNTYKPLVNDGSKSAPAHSTHTPRGGEGKLQIMATLREGLRRVEMPHHTEKKDSGKDVEDDDENAWQVVTRADRGKTHRRAIRHTQNCRYGISCAKKDDCGSRHTDEELRLFRMYPNLDFRWWKTKPCDRSGTHSSKDCPRAHSADDARCLACNLTGHFTEDCSFGAQ